MNTSPDVTILVPCRNERTYIDSLIDDIVEQDYDNLKCEVLIIDGQSDDGTSDIIREKIKNLKNFSVIENEMKNQANAMNIGVKQARGKVIIRMDVHCSYPKDYISTLVDRLYQLNAWNVGGVCITRPGCDSRIGRGIAIAISSPVCVGDSKFRIASQVIEEVDTVPFGCFRREVFNKIGLFSTDNPRGEDDEFNARIKAAGGKIYLIPEVRIDYYGRETLGKLAKMFYQYGYSKNITNRKIGRLSSLRQLAPPLYIIWFAISISFSLFFSSPQIVFVNLPYLGLVIGTATFLALKNHELLLVFAIFASIIISHFAYGIGYLKGFLDQMFTLSTKSFSITR